MNAFITISRRNGTIANDSVACYNKLQISIVKTGLHVKIISEITTSVTLKITSIIKLHFSLKHITLSKSKAIDRRYLTGYL